MTEPAPVPPNQPPVVEQMGARLHPLTPFVKGWGYFAVAAVALVNNEGLRSNLEIAGLGLVGVLIGGILLGTIARIKGHSSDQDGRHRESENQSPENLPKRGS